METHVKVAVAALMLLSSFTFGAATGGRDSEAPVVVFDADTSWAFSPPTDTYRADAVLDLRSLNEKVAGETGFIGLSQDGMDFVKGDGTPIRFWSIVSGPGKFTHEQMDVHTRFLAKLGVNMARAFGAVCDNSEGAKITDVNDKVIDGLHYYVAAAKKNGIYCMVCPFWAHATVPGSWGIEGYSNEAAWGVLFFNDDYQEGFKAWVRELYTRTNKYTGIPLKDEPAVAIIQIMNEDSLLFHTFKAIKEPQLKILRTKFGNWLKDKYGSLAQATNAWQGESHEQDDFAAGELGLYQTWEFTLEYIGRSGPAKRVRMADQLHFLAWIQRKFYADMADFYRNELGCKQLINAMNWKSGDPIILDDVERWTYSANEVIAVNRYTGVTHVGENRGYRIDPGHLFISEPVVKNPATLPCALKQVQGAPFMITESAWVRPTRYKAVGPMLIAAYMSLTGVDSLYWFAVSQPQWELDSRRLWWPMGDSYTVTKWSGSLPEQMGMFPANALAFRHDYIAAAQEPVVHEERSLASLWRQDVPIISEGGKFDPNRDEGAFAAESGVKQDVDRLAFLVGPVEVKYGGDEQNTRVLPELDSYIDREKGVVKSVTSQIALDYKDGILRVNAPKYQGVGGFLRDGGGTYELTDVTITSGNEYAAIIVTAMDDKPLKDSGKVLVQVGTIARPTGWATQQVETNIQGRALVMQKIIDTGDPPLRIDNTRAWIEVRNPHLNKATLLDVSGYKAAEVPFEQTGEALQIALPPNTMYLVLESEPVPDKEGVEEPQTPSAPEGEAVPSAGPDPAA